MCARIFSLHNREIKIKFRLIGAAAIATALASPALAQAVISDPRLLCSIIQTRTAKIWEPAIHIQMADIGEAVGKRLIQPWAITGTIIIAGVTADWPSNGHRFSG
jgi:hypothetical protein